MVLAIAQSVSAAVTVSESEQSQWLRWMIPLPKKISIPSKINVPASEVKITLRQNAGDTEANAADQLTALFKEKGNADGTGKIFEILVGICDSGGKIEDVTVADAADLRNLPNWEQAYCIRPVGENRLVLTAIHEYGVYYAAQTLRQLLESKFDKASVTIPLVSVTDWPDMAERGQWGGNITKTNEILWMARHKMNLIQYHTRFRIGKDGRGYVPIRGYRGLDPDRIAFGRRHAIRMVPMITHYSVLGRRSNLFDVYPELKGKIRPKGKFVPAVGEADVRFVPCPSQPKMTDVLADFMCAMAEAGATEIDCWLTEGQQVQCACEKCLAEGEDSEYALEARAYVNAWGRAVKQYPELKIRIALTQGSYKTNDKVLAEVPSGVGVTYYDGGRTYNSTRDPMIYPLLEEFAAGGGWLGVMPQLTASFAVVSPWTGPQFIRYRMNEFVDKKLRTLAAYATPNNRLYDFNVTAAAEWSWNAKGRTEREFALAWATRRGISDPEAAADWAVMLGPVSWDVYGSKMPYHHFRDGMAAKLVANQSRPLLGNERSMFRYFPTVEHMDHDLAVCDKAMAIAKRLDVPAVLHETRIIQGYVRMVKEIYTIATQVGDLPTPTYADRRKLQQAMNRLTLAGHQTSDGLEQWDRSVGPGLSGYGRFRENTIGWVEQTTKLVGDALASSFGVRRFTSPCFRARIGVWNRDDFKDKERITAKWDVTGYLPDSGTCEVSFVFTGTSAGLSVYRAALVCAPANEPDQLTELSADTHTGFIGYRSTRANVYTVTLDQRDPALSYFVLADIKGSYNNANCDGDVWLKTLMGENRDPAEAAAELQPMTGEELAKANLPEFTGKGLRVGVMEGGVSSAPILKHLRTVDGIDAEMLSCPNKFMLEACEAVVLPLISRDERGQRMAPGLADAFRDYVRAGGGLLMTAALGVARYPDVCKFKRHGGSHDYAPWIVLEEHPVSHGIEMNKALPGTGFCVEYECGSNGVTVARSAETRDPLVIAGVAGKGRVVICGLDIKLDREDTHPSGKNLIENAVRWCAGQEQTIDIKRR